jgi:hypothetical protein
MPMREKLEQGKTYFIQRRTGSYRSMYQKIAVVGETSRSYIIASVGDDDRVDWSTRKIPKTLAEWHVGSKEDADLFRWCIANRHHLSQVVGAMYEEDILFMLALKLEPMCPWLHESLEKFREDQNEKESNQLATTEADNGDGAAKA